MVIKFIRICNVHVQLKINLNFNETWIKFTILNTYLANVGLKTLLRNILRRGKLQDCYYHFKYSLTLQMIVRKYHNGSFLL